MHSETRKSIAQQDVWDSLTEDLEIRLTLTQSLYPQASQTHDSGKRSNIRIGGLSTRVFETRTATGREHFVKR